LTAITLKGVPARYIRPLKFLDFYMRNGKNPSNAERRIADCGLQSKRAFFNPEIRNPPLRIR
jgi:hypothetical protein